MNSQSLSQPEQLTLIQKIERLALEIITSLAEGRYFSITLLKFGRPHPQSYENPSNRERLARLLYLMSKSHWMLTKNQVATKRDIYYEDVGFFKSQNVLDRSINDLISLLKASRKELMIEVSAKGLIAGNMRWVEAGQIVNLSEFGTGKLIPSNTDGMVSFETPARFILVVEKDAIFQKLLSEDVFSSLGEFILVTGKGYPDLATRSLIKKLSSLFDIPAFVLVDCDPYGIDIASCIKWGSEVQRKISKRTEQSQNEDFIVPGLIWIGLKPSELNSLALPPEALLQLNEKDERKLTALEKRIPLKTEGNTWLPELEEMKRSKVKAELESISSLTPTFLSAVYLKLKIKPYLSA